MDLWRFDRADRVGTEILIVLLWVASSAALLVDPLDRWAHDKPLLLSADPDGSSLPVSVDGASGLERMVVLVPQVVVVLLLGIGAYLTIRVLRDIVKGDAFLAAQCARLRVAAALMLIAPPLVSLGSFGAEVFVRGRLSEDIGGTFTVSLPWILGGLIAAAFAQAFAAGAALRDSTDGLI